MTVTMRVFVGNRLLSRLPKFYIACSYFIFLRMYPFVFFHLYTILHGMSAYIVRTFLYSILCVFTYSPMCPHFPEDTNTRVTVTWCETHVGESTPTRESAYFFWWYSILCLLQRRTDKTDRVNSALRFSVCLFKILNSSSAHICVKSCVSSSRCIPLRLKFVFITCIPCQ